MIYLSLGAGVQSSTLALMAAKGELPERYKPECAFFSDTGAEPASVYVWLDWLERQLPFPVHRVSGGHLQRDSLRLRTNQTNGRRYWKGMVPFFVRKPDGGVGLLHRKCTANYKITPLARAVRKHLGAEALKAWRKAKRADPSIPKPALGLMGISRDEVVRMKPSTDPVIELAWPLIDLGMRRSDCLDWMERNGYPRPPRSACVFCPYHSREEWKRLKNEEPAEFDRAVLFEADSQDIARNCEITEGIPFLSRELKPLSEIDFDKPDRQMNLFGDGFTAECEGMCGV